MLGQQPTVRVPVDEFLLSMHDGQIEIFRDFDNRAARFFLINWHRRARKSTLALNMLIRECINHPNSRYGYITSTYRAARNIIWLDYRMLKRYLPMVLVDKMNDSEMYVRFKNGSLLSVHGADNPDSIRGIDFHGIVMDEAPLCDRTVWEEIIRPIIAQDRSRWAIFIFTPKGRGNWIYEKWINARSNPEWSRYLLTADDSGIIPLDELEKAKREIPQATYEQEFECKFNDSSSSVFKNYRDCISGEREEAKQQYTYVTGIDLAKVNDWTVITTICRETRHVVAFERFNQVDWALQKERILAHCRKYNSPAIMDATGVGDPVAEDVMRQGVTVVPFKIGAVSKKELIEKLIVTTEQRLITFPNIPELVEELSIFAYDVTDLGNIRYSAPEGCHDDCVISLALAVHGLKNFVYGKKPKVKPFRIERDNQYANAGIGYGN